MTSSGRLVMAEIGYAELDADFSTASAVDVDTGLSVPFTATGRPCLAKVAGLVQCTVANAVIVLTMKDEAATSIDIGSIIVPVANAATPYYFERRLQWAAGTAKVLHLWMRTGSGTAKIYATNPDEASMQVISL